MNRICVQVIVFSAVATLFAGCGNSSDATPLPSANTPPVAVVPGAPAVAPTPMPAVAPGGSTASNFGTLALNTGFMPDPTVARGTSGGANDASSNAGCAGWIATTPDHILQAGTPFTSVRVMAASDQDVTLVIQKPDGTYACNDDTDGTNPVVDIANAPAGTYRIWVGSYQQGVSAPYRLGVTEIPANMPSALPQ